MRIWLVFPLLVLAGCEERPVIQTAVPLPAALEKRIPEYLTKCVDEPNGQAASTNEDAAQFIEDLRDAGRDCRRKHKTLVNIIKGEAKVTR